uniref:Putative DNA polymerase n=1 Tax=viral metagenome TaxID=1070528 RepID=A0A6M3K8U5_9ZZZZ
MAVDYYGSEPLTKDKFRHDLMDSPPEIISVDCETVSLTNRRVLGFGIATSPEEAWYFKAGEPEIELVRPLLNNPKITKVFHNAIFDLRCMPGILDVETTNIADTNIMARLQGFRETKLFTFEDFTDKHTTPVEQILAAHGTKVMTDLPPMEVSRHCAQDVMATLALYHYLSKGVKDWGYLDFEMKALPIILKMSLRGLKVDAVELADQIAVYQAEKEGYLKACNSIEPFNPGSTVQVGYILSKRGNMLPIRRRKDKKTGKYVSKYVTDIVALEKINDPLATWVLNYRHTGKMLSTYLLPLLGEDRAYTEYNFDAVVGRISSARINMQNIPFKMRCIFLPDSGLFTTGDYSQEHLRILCYLSGDREMAKVYYDGEYEGDIHSKTARELNVSRDTAKTINYAIPYGATANTINEQGKLNNIKKASMFLDRWFETYRDAAAWLRAAQDYGVRHMWSLDTLFGRSIAMPEEYNRQGELNIESVKRKAVNYPILGTDGEVMKRAVIICNDRDLPLAVTVHDSITCDGDIEFPIDSLENITPFRIPFIVKKTFRWE